MNTVEYKICIDCGKATKNDFGELTLCDDCLEIEKTESKKRLNEEWLKLGKVLDEAVADKNIGRLKDPFGIKFLWQRIKKCLIGQYK